MAGKDTDFHLCGLAPQPWHLSGNYQGEPNSNKGAIKPDIQLDWPMLSASSQQNALAEAPTQHAAFLPSTPIHVRDVTGVRHKGLARPPVFMVIVIEQILQLRWVERGSGSDFCC
jgi:hypothetical protein